MAELPIMVPVEMALRSLLLERFPALAAGPRHVGTSWPADLADVLPFVRVRRISGSRDQLVDSPLVAFDVFHSDWESASALAEGISALFLGFRGRVAGVSLDDAEENQAPVEFDWDDDRVVRFGSTIRFSVRR